MIKKSAKNSRISAGVDRFCSVCNKAFYVGVSMDGWNYKVSKGGHRLKYQCGYKCWRVATEVKK